MSTVQWACVVGIAFLLGVILGIYLQRWEYNAATTIHPPTPDTAKDTAVVALGDGAGPMRPVERVATMGPNGDLINAEVMQSFPVYEGKHRR